IFLYNQYASSWRIINLVLTYVTKHRCCCTVIEACPPWEYLPLYIPLFSRPRAEAANTTEFCDTRRRLVPRLPLRMMLFCSKAPFFCTALSFSRNITVVFS
ncbi:hypothetical protein IscW_ISCW016555, partial [Ixodes scapularis]